MAKFINSKSFYCKGKTYKIGDLYWFASYRPKNGKIQLPITKIQTHYMYGYGLIRHIVISKIKNRLRHQILLDIPLRNT